MQPSREARREARRLATQKYPCPLYRPRQGYPSDGKRRRLMSYSECMAYADCWCEAWEEVTQALEHWEEVNG